MLVATSKISPSSAMTESGFTSKPTRHDSHDRNLSSVFSNRIPIPAEISQARFDLVRGNDRNLFISRKALQIDQVFRRLMLTGITLRLFEAKLR